MKDRFFYGGQAVIEGVMMRGRRHMAIAVRKGSGEILVKDEELRSLGQRYPILQRPVLRGVIALYEAMVLGIRTLTFSANQFAEEEGEELGAKEMILTMLMALALTVGLFVVLPAFIIRLIQDAVVNNVLLNSIEGAIKISFFILYILAISFMQDIRRVFQYHGAEHKAINCYEADQELTVNNVAQHSLIHTRCGTNFILIVMLMSILLFSFFGRPPFFERVLIHLALLPVVAGLSYEIIRHAAQERALGIVRLIARPGMWLQRLTTRPPDADQIEVAIKSLQTVLDQEAATDQGGEVVPLRVSG